MDGVHFPRRVGGLRTGVFGTAVLADAVRGLDADLAQSIERGRRWRQVFPGAFRSTTALSAAAGDARIDIANDGLRSVRSLLRFGSADQPLSGAATTAAGPMPDTVELSGTADPVGELQVPVGGELVGGDRLREMLADWRIHGYVEPGFLSAISAVIDHPEWLSLPGYRVVLLGAGADLGPYRALAAWGADLTLVDLPGAARWRELQKVARAGAATVRFPTWDGVPGADLVRQLPALSAWLTAGTDPQAQLLVGSHARVDGARGVLVAAASDALVAELLAQRPNAAVGYLGGPTDCYAVGPDVMADARRRARSSGRLTDMLRLMSGSQLFQPNYQEEVPDDTGHLWGVADAMLVAQGPNLALAQRLHRWRAIVATEAGRSVSYNVAPPVWSRSVYRHQAMVAAFHGARRFGIRVFEPATARVLLAAKLVADLYGQTGDLGPRPEGLGYRDALHGGLWRQPFVPASILNVLAVSGVPGLIGDRLPFVRH